MLTSYDLGRISALYEQSKNISLVARTTRFARSTIKRALDRNFASKPYQRPVSQKVLRRLKEIKKLAKKTKKKGSRTFPTYPSSRCIAAALARAGGDHVSPRTIRRNLRSAGLRPYIRPRTPTRHIAQLEQRREFARKALLLDWRRIIFTDESWLSTNEQTSKIQWATSRSAVLPLERKARWNLPSIMVWGAVGYRFKGPLIIFPAKTASDGELRQFRLDASAYVRRCLSTIAPDLVHGNRILQQDGARAHVARTTKQYLDRKGISFISDWPAYSPDLNAIERIWHELKVRVGVRCPMTQEELVQAAREAWEELPQSIIDRHCIHFPHQLKSFSGGR